MAEPAQFFDITPSDPTMKNLKDKVVLITGASSGIGLATTKLMLDLGAKVAAGDMNPCPITEGQIVFQQTDVRDWNSQAALFKKAVEKFGRVDHVFANAGISSVDNFCTDHLDANGELLPPDMKTMDINLTGCIYTCKLGIHYIRKNGDEGGSVVMTASASSYSPFILSDYGVAKHGVLGLMRNLQQNLVDTNIRSNCVTPYWTATGLVPAKMMEEKLGVKSQGPDVIANAVALLMSDPERNAQTIFSKQGRHKEVDRMLIGTVHQFTEYGEGDGPTGAKFSQQAFLHTLKTLAEKS